MDPKDIIDLDFIKRVVDVVLTDYGKASIDNSVFEGQEKVPAAQVLAEPERAWQEARLPERRQRFV
jgi:hypothetical protein